VPARRDPHEGFAQRRLADAAVAGDEDDLPVPVDGGVERGRGASRPTKIGSSAAGGERSRGASTTGAMNT
jgi:hypothetical protein